MGGPGSGNHFHHHRPPKRATVEQALSLDAARWMRDGILRPQALVRGAWRWTFCGGRTATIGYEADTRQPGNPFALIWYTRTPEGGESERFNYVVELTSTRPHFGGLRWWFLCPFCGQRVGKLHLPPGGRYFGCRTCHDLTYTSCQDSGRCRWLFRAVAEELGTDESAVRRLWNQIGKDRR